MGNKNNPFLIEQYDDFIVQNRKNINKSFNIILWFCLLVGPAVAVGVLLGVFPEVEIMSCIWVTVFVFVLASTHSIINWYWPSSVLSSLYVLVGIDIFLVLLANYHMAIQLTFVVVPVLSLMFCDRKLYYIASILNYVMLMFSTCNISLYNSANRIDYSSPTIWFANYFASYSVEMVFIFIVGLILLDLIQGWFGKMYREQKYLTKTNERIESQLEILKSMSQTYDRVLFIDYTNNKVYLVNELGNDFEYEGMDIDILNKDVINNLDSEYVNAFLKFADLDTLRERMKDRTIIAQEFLTKDSGWVRFQCIVVNVNKNGVPISIVSTEQNIDAQKRHEERLVRISYTDEMTGLCNRRCYETDVSTYSEENIDDKLVFISVDVNGLKSVNDKKGHAAGDELIVGAAECLNSVFADLGVVYRIGGDEFVAICFADEDEFANLIEQLKESVSNWRGRLCSSLSLSIGYARSSEYPKTPISELAKIADAKMYKDKQQYYRNNGIERRAGTDVYRAICESYIKILNVNLESDSYELIQTRVSEMTYEYGYSGKYSEWIKEFVDAGFIHEDDKDEFMKKTDIDYLKEYFDSDETSLRIFYRRKNEDAYDNVMLEFEKPSVYSRQHPKLYIFVKDINSET